MTIIKFHTNKNFRGLNLVWLTTISDLMSAFGIFVKYRFFINTGPTNYLKATNVDRY